jgi:hypothetical protein
MHPINAKLTAALKLINEAAQMERALYCPVPSGVPEMTEEDASLAHRLIYCIAGALLEIEGADGDVEEALREREDCSRPDEPTIFA